MKLPPYKEHGLLLSPELVKANLANAVPDAINPQRKTETRRDTGLKKINENPDQYELYGVGIDDQDRDSFEFGLKELSAISTEDDLIKVVCPYGVPGDLIYFKERHYAFGYWEQTTQRTKKGKGLKRVFLTSPHHPVRFDGNEPSDYGTGIVLNEMNWYQRNSLFMPKSYARQWALIEGIEVQRLQDITDESAINEGVYQIQFKTSGHWWWKNYFYDDSIACTKARDSFMTLFKTVNDIPITDSPNPWVWVIKYRPLSFDGRPSEYTICVAREELFESLEQAGKGVAV